MRSILKLDRPGTKRIDMSWQVKCFKTVPFSPCAPLTQTLIKLRWYHFLGFTETFEGW